MHRLTSIKKKQCPRTMSNYPQLVFLNRKELGYLASLSLSLLEVAALAYPSMVPLVTG